MAHQFCYLPASALPRRQLSVWQLGRSGLRAWMQSDSAFDLDQSLMSWQTEPNDWTHHSYSVVWEFLTSTRCSTAFTVLPKLPKIGKPMGPSSHTSKQSPQILWSNSKHLHATRLSLQV